MDQGFKEAEYLIENTLEACSHNFWKARLDYGVGEVMLREGRLKLAEEKLTKAIKQSEILMGQQDAVCAKIFRVETRIRLNKFKEAYEDCNDVFKARKKSWTTYEKLIYTSCFYHAAFIKYKQEDLKKSMEHFFAFFQGMQEFCKEFLGTEAYKALENKGAFTTVTYNQKRAKEDIKVYLKNSVDIFTAIYRESHPFVCDYLLPNYREANKPWYKLF
jgi:tetratricopeptide (TPR) repeat protein